MTDKNEDETVEITEEQLNDIARFCLLVGLDPTDKKLSKKLASCDCTNCRVGATMVTLFGDRIALIKALDEAPNLKH